MIATVEAPAQLRLGRVALAGGGTAGHVYPALAVLDEVESDPLWLGSARGLEAELVPRAGVAFRAIPSGAVLGRAPLALAGSALRNIRGFVAARAALRSHRPRVVFGTGGYVSVPAIAAARSLSIPTAIFLPDVHPGLAVKALSRIVDRVACTTEESRHYLPAGKVVATGYPVRREARAWAGRRAEARGALGIGEERVLLAMGGSQGARAINQAVWRHVEALTSHATVLHVTGSQGISDAERIASGRYRPMAYAHEVGQLFAAADLVIARAGASVLGELPAFGLPGVLVPGRFAGGHQRHNAQYLADAGAAAVLDEERLTEVAAVAAALLADTARLRSMAEAARSLDRPRAASDIASLLLELAR